MKTFYKILILTLVVSVTCGLHGCKDDLSALDTQKIDGVVIDTTGMPQINIFQFDTLSFQPKLVTALPAERLSYEWWINLEPESLETLRVGTAKQLSYPVSFTPTDPGDYHQLTLKVTDIETGIAYWMGWPLTIRNSIGEGLVIAETYDGTHTDFSHIMSPLVTPNYSAENIRYQVFSSVNGYALDGLVRHLRFAQVQGSGQVMLGGTDNSLFTFKTLDYTFDKQNEALFYAPQENYGVSYSGMISQNDIIVMNNRFYANWLQIARFGLPQESSYPIPAHIAVNSWYNYPNVVTTFYAEEAGYFVYQQTPGSFGDRVFRPVPAVSTGPFNPNQVPGKTNVAAAVNDRGDFMHLLKDKQTGDFGLYIIEAAGYDDENWVIIPSKPKSYVNLAGAPEIDQAEYFLLLDNQQAFLYATKTKIYAVVYGTSTPSYALRYTVPAGEEITTLHIYQQADYPMRNPEWDGAYFSRNNRQLVMSTYNGTSGTVNILPLNNVGEAGIDVNNIKQYGGFGRVLATATQL